MKERKNVSQKRALLRKSLSVKVIVTTMLVLSFMGENTSHAMFDEASAVHIAPEEIGEATLAVGTHLIYIDAADDTIYEIAAQSAEQSGQTEMYYKSEFGGGAWYCLDSAQSLEDITEGAVKAKDSEIAELLFTHHTREDGITYDLLTGEAVNIFSLTDPYSLSKLPELDELANQMQVMEASGADVLLITDFFAQDMQDEQTGQLDMALEALERSYRNIVSEEGSGTGAQMLRQVMGRADAERRGIVYGKLADSLNGLMDTAASGKLTEGGSELLTVIGNTLKKVQERVDALADEGLYSSDALSALTAVEDQLTEEVLQAVENEDYAALKSRLSELGVLDNIRSGVSTDMEAEKRLLDERLIPEAQRLADGAGGSTAGKEMEYYEEVSAELAKELSGDSLSEEEQTLEEIPAMTEIAEEAVEATSGASLDGKDQKELAAALIGISLFCGQEGSGQENSGQENSRMGELGGLLEAKAKEAAKKDGSYVFHSLSENGISYAPVDVIAELRSMRYVWSDSRMQAVLADRDSFYCFTALSDEVNMAGNKSEQMEGAALFQSVLCLPGEYVKETFECDIYPLAGTEYSVLADKATGEAAERVCEGIRAQTGKSDTR
ncbi:MAG TPA: hypothetical protein H9780_03460 [Candidatus Mediterraneibacter merdavium]|nr:hypothetical protein [Candidatus Mediterraneibacter merdavium]